MTVNEMAAREMAKSYENSDIATFSKTLRLPDKNEIISILKDNTLIILMDQYFLYNSFQFYLEYNCCNYKSMYHN